MQNNKQNSKKIRVSKEGGNLFTNPEVKINETLSNLHFYQKEVNQT